MSAYLKLVLVAVIVSVIVPAGNIDRAHSQVKFTVTKWGFVEVEGRFEDFEGEIVFDRSAPEKSRVDWRVKIASVRTGEKNRDEGLQAREYFDATRFPELRFVSDRVRPGADGALDVQGQLTMRGVTKPLTIRVASLGTHTVPHEGTFQMFRTDFTVNRYDFGIVGGSVLGPVISKDVNVRIVAAARAPQQAANVVTNRR